MTGHQPDQLSEAQQRELNELGRKKPSALTENEAAFLAWRNNVWIFLWENYAAAAEFTERTGTACEARMEAIQKLCEHLDGFEPEKGDLSNYALRSIADNQRHYYSRQRETTQLGGLKNVPREARQPAPVSGETEETEGEPQAARPTVMPIHRGGEADEERTLDLPADSEIDGALLSEAYCQQMSAMILNFKQLYPGNKGNPSKQRYYRMWFSEKTKQLLEAGHIPVNQADTLKAVHFDYLNYFLVENLSLRANQTLSHLLHATPKKKIKVGFQAAPVAVRWTGAGWLDARVPRGYIEQCDGKAPADSVISAQRKAYCLDLKALFRKNDLIE